MTQLQLPIDPTLKDFLEYDRAMAETRGFSKETIAETFMLLLEECGEFAKSARKTQGIKNDVNSKTHNPALEAADVFIYLLRLCNKLGIDLEQAFREKEDINKQRQWK